MWTEPVDEVAEGGFELWIVVDGMVADEGDHLAVVVGGLAAIVAGLADHAEPVVAIMRVWESG